MRGEIQLGAIWLKKSSFHGDHMADATAAAASAELAAFPKKFQLKANLVSLHHRVAVLDMEGAEIGSYHQALVSLTPKFHLSGKDGHTMAVATKSVISWGTQYVIKSKGVTDKYEIQEKKLSSAVHAGDIFAIEKNGVELVSCQKTDLGRDKIVVSQKDGTECATMTKAYLGIRDTWKITVKEGTEIPAWVLGFFAAIVQIQSS